MRNHYIPREYLRGFAEDAEKKLIWRFEKGTDTRKRLPIEVVGQETDLYPAEVETELNEKFEIPANNALRRLRSFEPLTVQDKIVLSTYFLNLRGRTPTSLESMPERIQALLPEYLKSMEEEERVLIKTFPDRARVIKQNFELIRNYINTRRYDPEEIWLKGLLVNELPLTRWALVNMNWYFLVSREKDVFITSDSPFYFTKRQGLNKPDSEVLIPISSRVSLWINWYHFKKQTMTPSASIIAEFNKRIVFNADKYIFSSKDYQWLRKYSSDSNLKFMQLDLSHLFR